jgi:hypothetical protein
MQSHGLKEEELNLKKKRNYVYRTTSQR